ncbi:MAG TPA: glycoside hydrolase family 3 N-terminal domain-containing protein, partial [Solirubrobacteraceae bacterium]
SANLRTNAAAVPAPPALPAAAAKLGTDARVAQLFLVTTDGTPPRRRDWGGLLVTGAPTSALRAAARRAHPPTLVASAALPAPPALGRMGAAQVRAAYRTAGRGLRSAGARLAVDLPADVAAPAGPMADRSFGDDPAVVERALGGAAGGLLASHLAFAVGHFPGQGAVTQDPLDGPASVGLSREELEARDLGAFRSVLDKAAAVTVSSAVFTRYDPVTPAALSPRVLRDELRDRLGFAGVAITDDLSGVVAVTGGRGGGTVSAAAVEALRAGADMVRVGDEAQALAARRAVVGALRTGKLPAARVNEALGRVLALKRRAGLR